ncbi:MAG: hypothetical protein JKY71_12375 [Alphaproteobacteria bacterium]|nr:hypothetical protein [Alphaproteobacteria bacterium]
MGETTQINFQIDQNTLGIVLDAFRTMRDTPSGVDYSMQVTSSPERLVSIIAKLEEYEGSGQDPVTISMGEWEWEDYTSFMLYGGTRADYLKPEVNDFLYELYDQYSDWEDNGFKPDAASNESI